MNKLFIEVRTIMTSLIPLRNKLGEIVAHAICSNEDIEEIEKFSWYMGDGYVHKTNKQKGEPNTMHQLVMHLQGIVVPAKQMIDHINLNELDNTRQNLRVATSSLNTQNQEKREGGSSIYKGVSYDKEKNVWRPSLGHEHLGSFTTELAAAHAYDVAVIARYGPGVGLLNGVDAQPEDTRCKQVRVNDYPIGVERSGKDRWKARHKRKSLGSFATMAAAGLAVLECRLQEAKLKEELHLAMPIVRNTEGIAVIKTSKGEDILVDDSDWTELMRYGWSITRKVASATIATNNVTMHHFLLPLNGADVIDHINRNSVDNRRSNLRRASHALNGHNKSKREDASSKYLGVFVTNNKFHVSIAKDYEINHFGTYEDELVAAYVHDEAARELYGDVARSNHAPKPAGWTFDFEQRKAIPDVINKKANYASKYHGVLVFDSFAKFEVRIEQDNKSYYFGRYKLEEVAAFVANKARIALFGEDASKQKINDVPIAEGWIFDFDKQRATNVNETVRKRSGAASSFHGVSVRHTAPRYEVKLNSQVFGRYESELVAAFIANKARVDVMGEVAARSKLNDIEDQEGWTYDVLEKRGKFAPNVNKQKEDDEEPSAKRQKI